MFEPLPRLLLGLFTGFLFGVLLQKGSVAKYRVIVGQFLLRDWTVVKVMGTAVITGTIGVFALHQLEMASLHIKPTVLGGVIAGGALFGIGMGLLGYCPGTSVAACGEGRKDAIAGVLGQLTGALLFVIAYATLDPLIKLGDFGKITLHGVTHTSPWLWIAALAIVWTFALYVSGRSRKKTRSTTEVSL
jgi:uncharacterized membrane protein YedE/YeeE